MTSTPPPPNQGGYRPPPPYGAPSQAQPGPPPSAPMSAPQSPPQSAPPPPAWAPQGAAPGTRPGAPGFTPPRPPGFVAVGPVHPVAWLVPVAALLAVFGAFTPWFDPEASRQGRSIPLSGSALYSWKDGKIGLLAPIVLVVVSISVVGLLRGKTVGRFAGGADPVKTAARFAMGAGAAAAVCLVIAWFLVPGQFHFTSDGTTYSWSDIEHMGVDLSRGPKIGFWLTAAAAVVAIVAGALMLMLGRSAEAARPAGQVPVAQGYPGAQQHAPAQPWGAAQQYGQPQQYGGGQHGGPQGPPHGYRPPGNEPPSLRKHDG